MWFHCIVQNSEILAGSTYSLRHFRFPDVSSLETGSFRLETGSSRPETGSATRNWDFRPIFHSLGEAMWRWNIGRKCHKELGFPPNISPFGRSHVTTGDKAISRSITVYIKRWKKNKKKHPNKIEEIFFISDLASILKFEPEGREFSNFLRSLEQFIQTVKGQNNFW